MTRYDPTRTPTTAPTAVPSPALAVLDPERELIVRVDRSNFRVVGSRSPTSPSGTGSTGTPRATSRSTCPRSGRWSRPTSAGPRPPGRSQAAGGGVRARAAAAATCGRGPMGWVVPGGCGSPVATSARPHGRGRQGRAPRGRDDPLEQRHGAGHGGRRGGGAVEARGVGAVAGRAPALAVAGGDDRLAVALHVHAAAEVGTHPGSQVAARRRGRAARSHHQRARVAGLAGRDRPATGSPASRGRRPRCPRARPRRSRRPWRPR